MGKVGLITLADGREDFFLIRKELINTELKDLSWLRNAFQLFESNIINSEVKIREWVSIAKKEQLSCLIIHLPIWADPIFTVLISDLIDIPILLMGNSKNETSSMVGLLGAGGALDQVGCEHERVFDHREIENQKRINAFIRAVQTKETIKGMTLGMFGSRSLGIFTTVCDPAQWHKIFGIDVKVFDQADIIFEANSIDQDVVNKYKLWVTKCVKSISYDNHFNEEAFDKQIRSYLATEKLAQYNKLDFMCVKCQQELSDGYTTQCISHMLMNGTVNNDGNKLPIIHACESDADGALTMLILSKLSGNSATSLLDVRNIDFKNNKLILANCGATASDFFINDEVTCGLSQIDIAPHIFGKAGSCACSGIMAAGKVTLARFTRKNGIYHMTVIAGEVINPENGELDNVTAQFPKALLAVNLEKQFLHEFGSNHLHMVRGDLIDEIELLCALYKIDCKIWK